MRQENEPGAIRTRRRQQELHRLAQKAVGHLHQDAGAVPGVRVGAAGAAMFEVDEEVESLADDGVRAHAFDVRDEADAAGVVFVAGPIEASLVTEVVHGRISPNVHLDSWLPGRRRPIREKRHT